MNEMSQLNLTYSENVVEGMWEYEEKMLYPGTESVCFLQKRAELKSVGYRISETSAELTSFRKKLLQSDGCSAN